MRDSLASGIDNGADKIMKARNDADSGWEGTASENFREQMTSGGGKADDFADAVREMAQKFEDIGGALKHAHREMDSVRGDAAAAGLQVDGAVIAHPGEAPPDPGSAPTGRDATAEAHQAHNDAVAAVKAHQAKVEAYNKASDDAEACAEPGYKPSTDSTTRRTRWARKDGSR